MKDVKHICRIPCNSLPLVGEADYSLCMKPVLHCDRIAPFHVLIYILKGRMEIVEDGVTYDLTPGTLFFLKSGVHHWGEKPFEYGTAWYYIHFYSQEPTNDMQSYDRPIIVENKLYLSPESYQSFITIPKLLKLPLGNEIEKEIQELMRLCQAFDMVRMNLSLWDILLQCSEKEKDTRVIRKEELRVQRVTAYLEQNYSNNFTSSDLEEAIGLTYKYIGSLFKANTGMTIKEYQIKLRIQKAVKLLCETDLSIADIATVTGFYDTFYFSKTFKRYYQVSPQRFRAAYIPRI